MIDKQILDETYENLQDYYYDKSRDIIFNCSDTNLMKINNLTSEQVKNNMEFKNNVYLYDNPYVESFIIELFSYFIYVETKEIRKYEKYLIVKITPYLKSWVLFHDIIDYYISEFKKIYIITNTEIYYDMLNNFYYLNDPLNLNSIDIKKYGIDNLDKEKNYLHKLIDDFIKPKDEDEIFNPDIAYLRNKNISYEEKYTYDNFLSLLCYIEEDLRGLIEDEKYID